MRHAIGGFMPGIARLWSRGIVGVTAAGLAVVACYGLLALTVLLPLVGIRMVLDETVWTAVIVVFTLLTVFAVIPGSRCHRSIFPAGAAISGSALILYALLVEYRALIELAGFALLITAVSADAVFRHRALGPPDSETAGRGSGHNGEGGAIQRSDGRQTS